VTRPTAEDADVIFVGFLLGHGGDALQMLALAAGLHRRGVRVRIVLPAGENSVTFKQRCDELGIHCDRSDLIVADMHGARQRLPDLFKLLRSLRAPIVHFHTGNSCLPRSSLIALTVLRFRKTFVTLQSPYETITPGSGRARFWSANARRRFAAVVSPSDHGSSFQLRCGVPNDLVVTIHNAVDSARMASGNAELARQGLGLAADDPIVLFCSRVDGQKHPVDAVRAFAAVAADFPTATLVIVGRGDLESDVAAEASRLGLTDRVRLVGYQTNVPDWLAASTVWILLTERENFSVAVLEAMAAGCAVLSTTCPGNDEVLVGDENSLTVPVGDLEAAGLALRRLLADPDLRSRLSAAARATSSHYDIERMVDAYCEVYGRVANLPASLRVAREQLAQGQG
jgi:glycosyltransferase involved in cell wall biosynthesis